MSSISVIISDFYCEPDALATQLAGLGARGHDLLLAQILDPEERRPEPAGATTLRDAESGAVMEVAADDLAKGYRARLDAHIAALRRAAMRFGGHHLGVDTDEPLDAALLSYLRFRARHP